MNNLLRNLMKAEGLQRERARHQMAELYLAPNGEIVPGTKWRNGARYNPMIGHTLQSTKKPPGPLYKRSRGF